MIQVEKDGYESQRRRIEVKNDQHPKAAQRVDFVLEPESAERRTLQEMLRRYMNKVSDHSIVHKFHQNHYYSSVLILKFDQKNLKQKKETPTKSIPRTICEEKFSRKHFPERNLIDIRKF